MFYQEEMEQSQNVLFHQGHLLVAALWIGYYALHSVLASRKVKASIFARFPGVERYYRIIYNVLAVLLILPILLAGAVIQGPRLLPENDALRYLAMFFATWGVILIRLTFKVHSFRSFAGFDRPDSENAKLLREGILGMIRHPMYAGGLLIVIGYGLFAPTVTNLIICVISAIYIFIGIGIEEKRLTAIFGEPYLTYKKEVPALIPRFRF